MFIQENNQEYKDKYDFITQIDLINNTQNKKNELRKIILWIFLYG